MITGQIYDHAARLKSFEIAAAIHDDMAAMKKRTPAMAL
jgi:hypothetical protein